LGACVPPCCRDTIMGVSLADSGGMPVPPISA
jgi:hypothetical protein